jgi:hypothetical protein
MYKLTQKFLVVSLLALAGCEHEANSGRIVGFIVDGQTGQRMNFFKAASDKNNLDDDRDSESQVYAIIDGEFRRAQPCGRGDLNDKNGIEADGCFQINGIPEGMEIPIFAQAPGYEKFIGELQFPLVTSDQEHAQFVGNIRMFPKGYTTDYKFNVSFNNQPVSKAQVICQYLATGGNSNQVSGNFLPPSNTGSATIMATSGDDGVATIPGAELVNGAPYNCKTVMTQALEGQTLSGESVIIAGVSQTDQRMLLYTYDLVDELLYAVRSNADDGYKLLGANGKLIVTFNRPVEIVPGTANCQTASAAIFYPDTDTNQGELYPTEAGNNASEQVITELSADGLTLTLGYNARLQFDPDDHGTYISFSGIVLRPRGVTDSSNLRVIGTLGACPAVDGYNISDLRNQRTGGFDQPNTIQLF